jgi:hypothetical protein
VKQQPELLKHEYVPYDGMLEDPGKDGKVKNT